MGDTGWTLPSVVARLGGSRDRAFLESVFASEVKHPPVCPTRGTSHDRHGWASPRVCSASLSSWPRWGTCPISSGT